LPVLSFQLANALLLGGQWLADIRLASQFRIHLP
jgi:hypothetical protein